MFLAKKLAPYLYAICHCKRGKIFFRNETKEIFQTHGILLQPIYTFICTCVITCTRACTFKCMHTCTRVRVCAYAPKLSRQNSFNPRSD